MKDFAQHGWKEVSLGEICEKTETVDQRKAPEEEFDYVDVSSVSNKTFTIGETQRLLGTDAPSRARRKIRSGDILFATIRPTLQRIAQVPAHLDDQVCSTGYIVLRPKPALDARFLMHSLFRPDFMDSMETLQSGASYPAVTDKQVRAQKIPLPPLEEQQRIVAVLDEAFEGLARAHAHAHAEANLQNARELFSSVLDSVFSGSPAHWTQSNLGATCTFVGGSQPPKSEFVYSPAEDLVRLIQIRDYKNDKNIVYIPRASARRFCEEDDVMIGRYGPPLFQILRGIKGAYNVALMKAIPDPDLMSKDFLYYFLQNGKIFQYINNASSRAAGQIGLNKATLEPYPISYPEKDEQREVVQRLDAAKLQCEKAIEQYTARLQDLDDLRQSLLQKAFAGELT